MPTSPRDLTAEELVDRLEEAQHWAAEPDDQQVIREEALRRLADGERLRAGVEALLKRYEDSTWVSGETHEILDDLVNPEPAE